MTPIAGITLFLKLNRFSGLQHLIDCPALQIGAAEIGLQPAFPGNLANDFPLSLTKHTRHTGPDSKIALFDILDANNQNVFQRLQQHIDGMRSVRTE